MKFDKRVKYLNNSVLMGITIIVIFAVVCVIAISRKSMEKRSDEAAAVFSAQNGPDFEGAYNETELQILKLLADSPRLTNSIGSGLDNSWSLTHYYTLADYFNRCDIILNSHDVDRIGKLIRGETEILQFETVPDLNRISLDGRKFILYIYEEIYNLCGLNITFDSENNIGKITEENGVVIYQRNVDKNQQVLHPEALFITVFLIISLTALCFIIAKKNQLFIKGGRYDGFDEKEYA
jgi:hypothetical protein